MNRRLSPDKAGLYVGPGVFAGEGAVITPIRWPPVVSSWVHEIERLKAIASGQTGNGVAYNGMEKSGGCDGSL
jgi:hypothetical protein